MRFLGGRVFNSATNPNWGFRHHLWLAGEDLGRERSLCIIQGLGYAVAGLFISHNVYTCSRIQSNLSNLSLPPLKLLYKYCQNVLTLAANNPLLVAANPFLGQRDPLVKQQSGVHANRSFITYLSRRLTSLKMGSPHSDFKSKCVPYEVLLW